MAIECSQNSADSGLTVLDPKGSVVVANCAKRSDEPRYEIQATNCSNSYVFIAIVEPQLSDTGYWVCFVGLSTSERGSVQIDIGACIY